MENVALGTRRDVVVARGKVVEGRGLSRHTSDLEGYASMDSQYRSVCDDGLSRWVWVRLSGW